MVQQKGLLPAVARIVIIAIWLIAISYLAFVWSLGQTIAFTSTGLDRPYDLVAGLVIQFGPQVFLYVASRTSESERGLAGIPKRFWFMVGFVLFSALDAFTNMGARYNHNQANGIPFNITHIFWYTLDVLIVFAEEVLLYGISAMSEAIADMIVSVDGDPPQWLRALGEAAHRGGTGRSGSSSRSQANREEEPPQLFRQH